MVLHGLIVASAVIASTGGTSTFAFLQEVHLTCPRILGPFEAGKF